MNAVLPLTLTVTKDPALLREYFELRGDVYRRHYPHLSPDFGDEEPIDAVSDILVARDEGRVVGGARLTVTSPGSPLRLPMEQDGFLIAELLPELGLRDRVYGEISRYAVDPSYAGGSAVSRPIARQLCDVAASRGADIAFAICPRGQLRLNRRNALECGVEFRHFPWIPVPNPFRIEMTLCAYIGMLSRRGK